MKRVGPAGSQMNGRSTQQIWLPRNRLPASHASNTLRATAALFVHCDISGRTWILPATPAQAINTASVSCMKPYSGEDNCVAALSDGVFHTTNKATGLSAPKMTDAVAKVIRTMASDCLNVALK